MALYPTKYATLFGEDIFAVPNEMRRPCFITDSFAFTKSDKPAMYKITNDQNTVRGIAKARLTTVRMPMPKKSGPKKIR